MSTLIPLVLLTLGWTYSDFASDPAPPSPPPPAAPVVPVVPPVPDPPPPPVAPAAPVAPTTWQLKDCTGKTWVHTDRAWLKTYVQSVNDRVFAESVARQQPPLTFTPFTLPAGLGQPFFSPGSTCVGGQCGR